MKKQKWLVVLMTSIFLVGCGVQTPDSSLPRLENDARKPTELSRFQVGKEYPSIVGTNTIKAGNSVDYGCLVFYFPYIEADFGERLAYFLKTNPFVEVASIAPNVVRIKPYRYGSNADYGATVGYWVVFREKK